MCSAYSCVVCGIHANSLSALGIAVNANPLVVMYGSGLENRILLPKFKIPLLLIFS